MFKAKESASDETVEASAVSSSESIKPAPPVSNTIPADGTFPEKSTEKPAPASLKSKIGSLLRTKKGKIVALGLAALLISLLVAVFPSSRYAVAGLVIKKDVAIRIIDEATEKKVSEATVSIAGRSVKTDKEGVAKMSAVPVGEYTVRVEKKYYKANSLKVTVPIFGGLASDPVKLSATGRQVSVTVVNKISKKPVVRASVLISDTSVITDDSGKANLVLPASTKPYGGKISAETYNDHGISIKVENKDNQEVLFELTPTGKIYFLSKRTGKIDVMKSNLDGTATETVVAGTGREQDETTVLLASRDWEYLALLSRRDGDRPKVYMINADSGDMKVVDEGNAEFSVVGWSGEHFLYKVNRSYDVPWTNKRTALKSYRPASAKLITLDETYGEGYGYYDFRHENINYAHIFGDTVVYLKDWWGADSYGPEYVYPNKKSQIISVKPDGSTRKTLREFSAGPNINMQVQRYGINELLIVHNSFNKLTYYFKYADGKVTDIPKSQADTISQSLISYLGSPQAGDLFWFEPRDGKISVFIADKYGENKKELKGLTEYIPYGWYTDDYLLLSKGGSELFIIDTKSATQQNVTPSKITDYHKIRFDYPGYGHGYGGF